MDLYISSDWVCGDERREIYHSLTLVYHISQKITAGQSVPGRQRTKCFPWNLWHHDVCAVLSAHLKNLYSTSKPHGKCLWKIPVFKSIFIAHSFLSWIPSLPFSVLWQSLLLPLENGDNHNRKLHRVHNEIPDNPSSPLWASILLSGWLPWPLFDSLIASPYCFNMSQKNTVLF